MNMNAWDMVNTFQNLTDDDLKMISDAVAIEQAKRREEKRTEMWADVKSALLAYIEEFGNITVASEEDEDTTTFVYIDSTFNFSDDEGFIFKELEVI